MGEAGNGGTPGSAPASARGVAVSTVGLAVATFAFLAPLAEPGMFGAGALGSRSVWFLAAYLVSMSLACFAAFAFTSVSVDASGSRSAGFPADDDRDAADGASGSAVRHRRARAGETLGTVATLFLVPAASFLLSSLVVGAEVGEGASAPLLALGGALLGAGVAFSLLLTTAWVRREGRGSRLPMSGGGRAFCAMAVAAALCVPLAWLGIEPRQSWLYLGVVTLSLPALAGGALAGASKGASTGASASAQARVAVREGEAPGSAARGREPLPDDAAGAGERRPVPRAAGVLWQPTVGLLLSLVSMALPWETFLGPRELAFPALGTEPLGWALPCAVLAVPAVASGVRRLGPDLAMRAAMPLTAALIVCLWMVGDISELGRAASLAKGACSGLACALCLGVAWAMSRVADLRLGLANAACLALELGASSLGCLAAVAVQRTLGTHVAAMVVPVASVLFLAAVCVDSVACVVRLQRRAQGPRPEGSPTAGEGGAGVPSLADAVEAVGRAYGLSPREVQVLGQLVGGRSAEGIAEVLGVSPNTVRAHTRRIHEKLGVSSRDEIVALVECRRAAGARL
jgi:DNA-binding CsgD family transcriptional regulator